MDWYFPYKNTLLVFIYSTTQSPHVVSLLTTKVFKTFELVCSKTDKESMFLLGAFKENTEEY